MTVKPERILFLTMWTFLGLLLIAAIVIPWWSGRLDRIRERSRGGIDYSSVQIAGDLTTVVRTNPVPVMPEMTLETVYVSLLERAGSNMVGYVTGATYRGIKAWYRSHLRGYAFEEYAGPQGGKSMRWSRGTGNGPDWRQVTAMSCMDGYRVSHYAGYPLSPRQRRILQSLSLSRVKEPPDARLISTGYLRFLKSPVQPEPLPMVDCLYSTPRSLEKLDRWFRAMLPDVREPAMKVSKDNRPTRMWEGPDCSPSQPCYTITAVQYAKGTELTIQEALH